MTTDLDHEPDPVQAAFLRARDPMEEKQIPADLLTRADRRRRARSRRRGLARAGAVAATVALAVGLGAVAVSSSSGSGPGGEVAVGGGDGSAGRPTPPVDSALAVLMADGSVVRHDRGAEPEVVADAALGVREVARGRTADELLVVTDGDGPDPCDGTIGWLRGGELSPVADGGGPALSPDGSRLAYVDAGPAGTECFGAEIVVRDLAGGEERRWSATEMSAVNVNDLAPVSLLSWSPDSSALAFGTYDGFLNVLDVEGDGSSVHDAVRTRGDRPGVQIPLWSRTGGLFVVDTAGGEENRTSPVVLVDPETGRDQGVVGETSGNPHVVAVSDDGTAIYVLRGSQPDAGATVEVLRDGAWTTSSLDGVEALATLD